mmetsp:Transcript_18450/g.39642  ORF Transcript_18450/g.39642 Transcript_18450/m.39642 type:complete len:304 (+) Transcript_18450:62-973(+)
MATPAPSRATHFVVTNAGVSMPRMIYGTAWKKERTTDLVIKAVLAGFKGIDTACQPKHYREDLVGEALVRLQQEHGVKREQLFLQTKFTSVDGQDPTTIPYDSRAPLPDQVRQSFAKSLHNLKTDYVDSLVLHSPMGSHGATMTVWGVFEKLLADGKVKQLGISNCYDAQELSRIIKDSKTKPAVVQNRFYDKTGYDKDVRALCREHNIIYQSFWTLTANPNILQSQAMKKIVKSRGWTPAQAFYRFVMQLGIVPLNGTTSQDHMREDLQVLSFPELDSLDFQSLKDIIGESGDGTGFELKKK